MTEIEYDLYIKKPIGIIQDKRLTPLEADFLCLIWQLENAGGCKASNQYFAEYFGLSRIRAVQTISSLRKKGFIETTEKKSGKETIERTITVLDEGSKKNLLRSKDSLQEVVRKTYRGSKKNYNHTLENTLDNNNISKIAFEKARILYPGSKRGLDTEFDNFKKKNKNWSEILPLIEPAIQREIIHKTHLKNSGQFCPAWKNFQTWINGRCWEQEFPDQSLMAAPWDDPDEETADKLLKGAI